jgi:hypothetical protein
MPHLTGLRDKAPLSLDPTLWSEAVEVITGGRRRRNWSEAEKARIVAESADADANISKAARRNGVSRGFDPLLSAFAPACPTPAAGRSHDENVSTRSRVELVMELEPRQIFSQSSGHLAKVRASGTFP